MCRRRECIKNVMLILLYANIHKQTFSKSKLSFFLAHNRSRRYNNTNVIVTANTVGLSVIFPNPANASPKSMGLALENGPPPPKSVKCLE